MDLDMESCLTEMERLQAKMIELKEQQQREVLENEKKVKNIEPNMMVIQEWLDNYSHNKKQKDLAEQAKKKKDAYVEKCRNRSNNKDPIQEEERKTIMENDRTYCNKDYPTNSSLITNPANLKPLGTFGSKLMGYDNRHHRDYIHLNDPSDFMKNYIEATYNIFQIQQTKIESLERTVALQSFTKTI
jgi:hypothetical protein